MAKKKRKKGSSTPWPSVPGTSQFARFSAASGPVAKKTFDVASAASLSAASSSATAVVEDSTAQIPVPDVVLPVSDVVSDVVQKLFPSSQTDILTSVSPQATSSGTSPVAVEANASGLVPPVDGFVAATTHHVSTGKESPALDNKRTSYASLLKDPLQLEEVGTPTQHISGAPFVLIPDESIEEAKKEFKDFIFAQFHGNYPEMGRVIGVVNALWARTGPRIFVHNIGPGVFLLRVTNPRTRALLLGKHVWNIDRFSWSALLSLREIKFKQDCYSCW